MRRWYLAFGLIVTWVAGMGRYWDNPKAHLWQLAGLGSVAYVIVLAAVVWAVVAPLRPARWSYRSVLIFVTLCSPPALLYAIPVERFMPMHAAQAINAWFLAVVAAWRVALLVVFLRRVARLSPWTTVITTLLPLTLIIAALAALNLEHAVFEIMAGLPDEARTPGDTSYFVVMVLSLLSIALSPILLIAYAALVTIARQWRRRDSTL